MLRNNARWGLVAGCLAAAAAWAVTAGPASADDASPTVTPAVYPVEDGNAQGGTVQLVRHHGYYGGHGWGGGWHRGWGWGGGWRGYGWGGSYRPFYRPYFYRPYYGYGFYGGPGFGYGYPMYGYGPGPNYGGGWW
jgi:hypothetical protein